MAGLPSRMLTRSLNDSGVGMLHLLPREATQEVGESQLLSLQAALDRRRTVRRMRRQKQQEAELRKIQSREAPSSSAGGEDGPSPGWDAGVMPAPTVSEGGMTARSSPGRSQGAREGGSGAEPDGVSLGDDRANGSGSSSSSDEDTPSSDDSDRDTIATDVTDATDASGSVASAQVDPTTQWIPMTIRRHKQETVEEQLARTATVRLASATVGRRSVSADVLSRQRVNAMDVFKDPNILRKRMEDVDVKVSANPAPRSASLGDTIITSSGVGVSSLGTDRVFVSTVSPRLIESMITSPYAASPRSGATSGASSARALQSPHEVRSHATSAASYVTRSRGASAASDVTRSRGASAASDVTRSRGASAASDVTRSRGASAASDVTRSRGVSAASDVTRSRGTSSASAAAPSRAPSNVSLPTRSRGTSAASPGARSRTASTASQADRSRTTSSVVTFAADIPAAATSSSTPASSSRSRGSPHVVPTAAPVAQPSPWQELSDDDDADALAVQTPRLPLHPLSVPEHAVGSPLDALVVPGLTGPLTDDATDADVAHAVRVAMQPLAHVCRHPLQARDPPPPFTSLTVPEDATRASHHLHALTTGLGHVVGNPAASCARCHIGRLHAPWPHTAPALAKPALCPHHDYSSGDVFDDGVDEGEPSPWGHWWQASVQQRRALPSRHKDTFHAAYPPVGHLGDRPLEVVPDVWDDDATDYIGYEERCAAKRVPFHTQQARAYASHCERAYGRRAHEVMDRLLVCLDADVGYDAYLTDNAVGDRSRAPPIPFHVTQACAYADYCQRVQREAAIPLAPALAPPTTKAGGRRKKAAGPRRQAPKPGTKEALATSSLEYCEMRLPKHPLSI